MPDIDVNQMMKSIPEYFQPEKAGDFSGIVQCIFSGSQASNWVIKIAERTCTVEEGLVTSPNLTVKADAQDGVNVLMGKMDPMRAFMLGKVKVQGDLSLGMKLSSFFKV